MKSSTALLGIKLQRFFFQPVSPVPLALLRISVGVLLLIQALTIASAFVWLFGNEGLFHAGLNQYFSQVFVLAKRALGSLQAFGTTFDESAVLVAGVYVASLVSLVLGYRTRLSATVVWLTHSLFVHGSPITFYGVDTYASVFLFYFMLFPTARCWSLDARAQRISPVSTYVDTLCLRMAQIHLAIAYFDAGLSKALGPTWWTGEAIWRALMLPEFRVADFSWFHSVPWLPVLIGISTVVLEIGYPVLIWSKRMRAVWLPAVIGMHLGIALFQGLHIFGAFMVALNVSLFGYPYLFKLVMRTRDFDAFVRLKRPVLARFGLADGLAERTRL